MADNPIRVLTNVYLPPVDGYALRTFGDYAPGGPDSAWRPEKERRPLADILPHIPDREKPDVLLISSPEYLPIPADLTAFPGPKILLITDWNVCLRFLPDLCALFDFCYTDWPGYRLLRKAGIANVHHQPLFGHNRDHFFHQGKSRNLDVSFCGNLNTSLHRERNRLLARLAAWGAATAGRTIHLGQVFNDGYVDVLNRSRLVFNYSIRGEANMRLYEAMACGAVPLVEASNQEASILFQEGRHYFRYEPDRLEKLLESLLADPARIEAAGIEARAAVARHTKGDQIRALLDHAGREGGARPGAQRNLDATFSGDGPDPAASAPRKALIKLRVLGAAYTMPEALGELQARSAGLPGLDLETLPAALLTLMENHPGEALIAAHKVLEMMLNAGGRPEVLQALFRLRLSTQRGRWQEALDGSQRCLEALDNLERAHAAGAVPVTGPGAGSPLPRSLRELYGHFYPPVDLGKGVNTDLNSAFRADLAGGSPQGYLDLMRAHCLAERARALLALDRPREALECAERIPVDRFASLEPHGLMAEACARTGDAARLRTVLQTWRRETPLNTEVWDKVAEGLDGIGDKAELIAFLEEILILSRFFLPPGQVEMVRARLEKERAG